MSSQTERGVRALAEIPRGHERVAVYHRTLNASVDGIWANVLDWEHIPWLHATTFTSVELLERGANYWRARVGLAPRGLSRAVVLELVVDRPGLRYTTQTLEGPGAGALVLTKIQPRGPRTSDIVVEFHALVRNQIQRVAMRRAYERVYRVLWDEDEAMIERTDALAAASVKLRARSPRTRVKLGPRTSVASAGPLIVELGGRRVRVLRQGDELVAHDLLCPHMGGPLDEAKVEYGRVVCPWHGYAFELESGRCQRARGLCLHPTRIELEGDDVVLISG